VPGAKVTTKPTKDAPVAIVDIDPSKGDVGDLAKAASAAKTPHRAKGAPEATLVLDAKDLKRGDAKKVQDALKDVKGVNSSASRVDVKAKEIYVKLANKGGAKLADIKKALANFTKS
jgi:hypothetical protein